jgi:hypothetical protein
MIDIIEQIETDELEIFCEDFDHDQELLLQGECEE